MKTLKVGIASAEYMIARTMSIARGELRATAADPKVWFTSPESFAKVLSNKNRALLNLIATTHPESLRDLAAKTGRKPSNLSRTLKTMEHDGLSNCIAANVERLGKGSLSDHFIDVGFINVNAQKVAGRDQYPVCTIIRRAQFA